MQDKLITIPMSTDEKKLCSILLHYCLSFPAIKPTSGINKKLNNIDDFLKIIKTSMNTNVRNIEISFKTLEEILFYSKGITNEFKSYAISGKSMIEEFKNDIEKYYPDVVNNHSLALDILPNIRNMMEKISMIYESNKENHEDISEPTKSIWKKIINVIIK